LPVPHATKPLTLSLIRNHPRHILLTKSASSAMISRSRTLLFVPVAQWIERQIAECAERGVQDQTGMARCTWTMCIKQRLTLHRKAVGDNSMAQDVGVSRGLTIEDRQLNRIWLELNCPNPRQVICLLSIGQET
jgi:hypothetical protein